MRERIIWDQAQEVYGRGFFLWIRRKICKKTRPFRATSKRTRIETQNSAIWRNGGINLSEQHPREQGLKPSLEQSVSKIVSYFQSNIQENKDWNIGGVLTAIGAVLFQSNIQENKDWNPTGPTSNSTRPSFQSNIQENKDWNKITTSGQAHWCCLSEQHPREQGLKQGVGPLGGPEDDRLSEQHPREQGLKRRRQHWQSRSSLLSEQHPREQGLKLRATIILVALLMPFRATSKRTRIETSLSWAGSAKSRAFQSNIQENKDWNNGSDALSRIFKFLSEQHPREQGLKPNTWGMVYTVNSHFQSNIQENKDWNFSASAQSTWVGTGFQSNIQENKDWNSETTKDLSWIWYFQSNIQENKDWNGMGGYFLHANTSSFRATSKRTRIETCIQTNQWRHHTPFRATSKRTRIETRNCSMVTRIA